MWKAADQQAPHGESDDMTRFGWDIPGGAPVPVLAHSDLAPPQLSDVISCQCRVQGKKCSTYACGCHKEHVSCTTYCNCSGEEGCCNQYTQRDRSFGRVSGWRMLRSKVKAMRMALPILMIWMMSVEE